jgi:glutamate/aspartate transport system substrate-binding protein
MPKVHVLLKVLMLALLSPLAQAAELDATLKKIKDSGIIHVGYHDRSFPFTYQDADKNVIGYAQDLVNHIAESLRSELGMRAIEVKRLPITMQNRFDQVQRGVVDIECNSTTNNAERQKQLAFSNTFFIATTRLLTRKDSGIKDFTDLRGKSVLVAQRTTSEDILRRLNEQEKFEVKIVPSNGYSAQNMVILESGQAQAYISDDALLYGMVANAWRPQDWVVTGKPQSREAYGCMMRKGETAFKAAVDRAISQLMKSGGAQKMYQKWLMSPPAATQIPPLMATSNSST